MEKLFNPKEVQFIQNHQNAILAFWQLWSVKESAYKAWQRINQSHPVFNPKRFVCSDFKKNSVNVNCENFQSKVKTIYTKNYIYSQCDLQQLSYHIFNSKASYHTWITGLSNQDWFLKKSDYNVPNLFNIKTKNTVPISISKDAGLVAVAW